MSQPHWNKIEFERWERGDTSVDTNYFGEGPIILELEGDGYETFDLSDWMTPDQARELASKLIEAADAADKAGPYIDQQLEAK